MKRAARCSCLHLSQRALGEFIFLNEGCRVHRHAREIMNEQRGEVESSRERLRPFLDISPK